MAADTPRESSQALPASPAPSSIESAASPIPADDPVRIASAIRRGLIEPTQWKGRD